MIGHAHRWRISEPDGRKKLPAVCLECGSTREYKATDSEVSAWDFSLGAQRDHTTVFPDWRGSLR